MDIQNHIQRGLLLRSDLLDLKMKLFVKRWKEWKQDVKLYIKILIIDFPTVMYQLIS